MRDRILATFFILVISGATANAGGDCAGDCYERVRRPPRYGVVAETVEVRPAQTYARHVPPVYDTVHETVVIRPEHTVQRIIPAQYATVAETVMVEPERRVWQVTRDGWGREIGCWVTVPARHAVRHRVVEISPARAVYDTVPAVYGARARTVLVSPGYVTQETTPAQYATRHRMVLVAPGYEGWRPLR